MSDAPFDGSYKYRDNSPHYIQALNALYTQAATVAYRNSYKIGRPEGLIINMIGNYGPLKATDIARIASFDKALITRAIQKLVSKEHITYITDEIDKRQKNITLTKTGISIFERNSAAGKERFSGWMKDISIEDQITLKKILQKLTANAEEMLENQIHKP